MTLRTEMDEYFAQEENAKLPLKSALIEWAARVRGVPVRRLTPYVVIVRGPQGDIPFRQLNGPLSSVVGRNLCDHKALARELLGANGIEVPESRMFGADQEDAAWVWAQGLDKLAVLKPYASARGRGVTVGVDSLDAFRRAWAKALRVQTRSRRPQVLVEAQQCGTDYRFFVVDGEVISVTERRRASVIGDGQSTIKELIDIKNEERRTNVYARHHMIPTDLASLDLLSKNSEGLDYVADEDERTVLRSESNIAAGGDIVDRTDEVHAGFGNLAVAATRSIPGIRYAGVDLIIEDARSAPRKNNYVVTEVEFSPGPIAHFPVEGDPRDMAGAVLDFYVSGAGLGSNW